MSASGKDELLLKSWIDADFANDTQNWKSVTGGVLSIAGVIIIRI